MASILDGLGLEGSILDGLDDWPRSATRKEWFRLTRELVASTISDSDSPDRVFIRWAEKRSPCRCRWSRSTVWATDQSCRIDVWNCLTQCMLRRLRDNGPNPDFQMKRLFLLALPALLASTPAFAEVDPKIHKLCIEAKDYSGCVKINNKLDSNKIPPKQVIDFLQDELYEGWTSYVAPFGKSITFIKPKTTEKLMVRSIFGRYFQFSYIQRDYVPPVPPTDGYYGAREPERTTCEWKQKKSVCTTYPATRRWHPGTPGQLETFKEESSLAVVDCKDKTAKWSKSNRSWRTTLPYFVKRSIKDFCQRIDTLPQSENKKYASGTPTSEELRFIDKNRIYN